MLEEEIDSASSEEWDEEEEVNYYWEKGYKHT